MRTTSPLRVRTSRTAAFTQAPFAMLGAERFSIALSQRRSELEMVAHPKDSQVLFDDFMVTPLVSP